MNGENSLSKICITAGRAKNEIAKIEKHEATIRPTQV